MGEYATHRGESVKIGTCEDMYYLRPDQVHQIGGYEFDRQTLDVVRFRFPFPDEDDIKPGHFDDHARGVRVPGYTLPATLNGGQHHSIQFTNTRGYNLCIPCPEGVEDAPPGFGPVDVNGIKVHRNGWNGGPVVSQQAYRGGRLVTLLRCGACGGIHRLDDVHEVEAVVVAFRAEADRTEWRRRFDDDDPDADTNDYGEEPAHGERHRAFLHAIADRILAGYAVEVPA